MASYISAKKKEAITCLCFNCNEQKEIVSYIRDDNGELQKYCKDCFEEFTGKRVSKR